MRSANSDTHLFFPIHGFFNKTSTGPRPHPKKHFWEAEPGLYIPAALDDEYSPGMARSGLNIRWSEARVSRGFSVDIHITYPCCLGIEISLVSPSGTLLTLLPWGTRLEEDIQGNFPKDFHPRDELGRLYGEPLDGLWLLSVTTWLQEEEGFLESWAIRQP